MFRTDYEHLFDVPQHSRTDNDVSPFTYLHSGRRLIMRCGRIVAGGYFLSYGWLFGNNDTVLEQPINFAIIIYQ